MKPTTKSGRKEKPVKKLGLSRQKVRKLGDSALSQAHGGFSCRLSATDYCKGTQ